MKAQVYSTDGKPVKEVQLPAQFSSQIMPELIARAAISDQTKHYQPKGNYPRAGMETSARYRGRKGDFGSGKNRGQAMLPHEILPKGRLGKVKRIPSAVKGRRAHPPKANKNIIEKINKKEYKAALVSAIAATADKGTVAKRGHKHSGNLPIVIEDSFESVSKTAQACKTLMALIKEDLTRAKKAKKRTGVRKRKASKKRAKSAIIAVSKDSPIIKAAKNIPGIEAVKVSDLSVEKLAPGAKPGRLAIYTVSALDEIAKL